MNKDIIAKGATIDTTTHRHKEHATAIVPFHSSFFESLHKEQWREVRLGEMIKTNCKSIDKNYPYNMVQYLDTGSITDNKIESLQKFDLADLPSRAKRLVQDNDIIYSLVRPIQRHFGFIKNPRKNLVVSTGFCTITTYQNILDSKFLYYFLTFDETIEFLDLIAEASTSAYPAIKPSDIENLTIPLPPLKVQQQIAEILSSFDDKIDLLHRQNKTLESLALTLFRHTFIDNPKNPNAPCHSRQACNCHSEPALAGEESIDIKSHRDISASPQYDKEKILIAENTPPNNKQYNGAATSVAPNEHWEMGRLGDYITPKKGKNITQKNAIKGIYPVIAGGLEPAYYHNQSNTESPVITISASGANAGFVNIHYCSVWSSDSSYIDKTITPYVYFFYLFLKMNQNILYDKQEGSAQPHIYPSHIMELEIPHYPKNLIETFESQIQIYFDKISHNMGEILNLQSMCDILLSKILNEKMGV